MKKAKRILIRMLCFALVFVMGGGGVFSAFSLTASAEEVAFDINTSSPLDDLQGATIDGAVFSVANFNASKINAWKVITLYEYGYSVQSPEYFNLYFYVYFPSMEEFEKVRTEYDGGFYAALKCGDQQEISRYPIEYVNHAEDPLFKGVFSKFKLSLTEEILLEIWGALDPEKRVYSTSYLDFMTWYDEGIRRIPYSGTFSCMGYMQGLDSSSAEASTLVMASDRKDTLHLDVKSTYYDIDLVNNDDGDGLTAEIDARDRLHSVYFSVPNHLISEYGEMTAVRATWMEALTAPALVAGDKALYDYMSQYLDVDYGANLSGNTDLQYILLTDYTDFPDIGANKNFHSGYALGFSYATVQHLLNNGNAGWCKYVSPLRFLFKPSVFGEDAADKAIITAEEMRKALLDRSNAAPGLSNMFFTSPSGAQYYRPLFESVSDPKVLSIRADDDFVLTGQMISQNWWQKIWGDSTVKEVEATHVKGIQKVTEDDFTVKALIEAYDAMGRGDVFALEALKIEVEERPSMEKQLVIESGLLNDYFYISDSEAFSDYYAEKTDAGETVYLLRYRVSDYLSEEATVFYNASGEPGEENYEYVGTNAYVFQMETDLGFDILDVTLTKEGVDTVIPVVMDAKDIFHDAKPPVNTNSDAEEKNFVLDLLKIILFVVILIVIFIALSFAMPFIRPVLDIIGSLFKTLFSLLLLPFRAIGNLFKRR